MIISPQTDAGRVRKKNEDNFLVEVVTALNGVVVHLFAVADGMGGHANGQDASQLAMEQLKGFLLPHLLFFDEKTTAVQIVDCLKQAIQQANEAICAQNRSLHATEAMGTTITAALVVGSVAYVANVGDSRTYLYRQGIGLSKITQDHSVVACLVDAGYIEPDDIYTHDRRNEIYRSLGEKLILEVDAFKVDVRKGDILLLCSDGLWEMVRDPEIEGILSSGCHPDEASRALVEAANNHGGLDNITAIVAQVLQGQRSKMGDPAQEEVITVPETFAPQPNQVPVLVGSRAIFLFVAYVSMFFAAFVAAALLDLFPTLGRIEMLGTVLQPLLIVLILLAVPFTCLFYAKKGASGTVTYSL